MGHKEVEENEAIDVVQKSRKLSGFWLEWSM